MSYPLHRAVGVRLAQMVGLAVFLALVFLILAGGSPIPSPVLKMEEVAQPTKDTNPFSLIALHKRLPAKAIAKVQRFVHYYGSDHKRGFEGSLARSTRYIEPFRKIFRQNGLPEELAYLPLIESGFDHTAVSPANAVGVWQFMEATGKRFDLDATQWADHKRDPLQSAQAAARYLKYLYQMFGNWELALAAYNAGEGSVRRQIKINKKEHKPTRFWDLDLPQETQGYVPAFLAAVIIAKNPGAFDFHRIPFQPELVFDQIKVHPGTSLAQLAGQMEISLEDLLELNPSLLSGMVPPTGEPYLLRIPNGMKAKIPGKLGSGKPGRDWMLYPITKKETPEDVATFLRAKSASILKVNQLRSNQELLPGRFLIIPL
ncbi:MAG: lytic transglycosylase domain-containing protein [Deltaproteobacteria bacterium]|nr:lytic transglycosylase domain-containing protein [Deltaproteobacteria bacterium]